MNLNNLMKLYDNDLFDDIVLPDGIDHDTVVNTILSESALNTPMYPEHDLFKMMIQNFFRKYYNNFDRYNRAMNEEYTPNENYHKTDERTIRDNVNKVQNLDGKQVNSLNENGDTENFRMAFDSGEYKKTDRGTSRTTNNDTYKQNDKTTTDSNRNGTIITNSHGLTGVYTNQRLVEDEVKLRSKYNVYKYISDLFYDEFMIKCM